MTGVQIVNENALINRPCWICLRSGHMNLPYDSDGSIFSGGRMVAELLSNQNLPKINQHWQHYETAVWRMLADLK